MDNKEKRFDNGYYIEKLKISVERKYGSGISKSSDYIKLASCMNDYFRSLKLQFSLSVSTIKRFYNAVNDVHQPYLSTLDIFSKYLGYQDFQEFSVAMDEKQQSVNKRCIFTEDLAVGDKIEIGWTPNARLLLRYEGECVYSILETRNSKLQVGDSFVASSFQIGNSLCLPYIQHGDELIQQAVIIGLKQGLTLLAVL